MDISAEAVKELRDQTGVSVMECKKALTEAGGDIDKALEILKERSLASVAKKAGRELGAGTVAAYVHNTAQVGSMVLLSCETDFVSKNEEFVALARDIAMHAAAMRPADTAALLVEPFIKDSTKTVADLISAATQKFGERIEVNKLDIFSVK
ncbi:MAG: translation elongation factor Ts [Chthoniobacterales bacterium]